MVPLIDNIRQAMRSPRGGRPVCLMCGRAVSDGDAPLGYPRAER